MPSEAGAAVAELYREVAPYALSKTAYLVGRQDVAEEIVQDAFVKLLQKPLIFETRRQAYAWVYTTCHNAAIDHLRSRRTAQAALRREAPPPLSSPHSPEGRLANRQLLERFLARLGERDARIIAYRYVDGLQLAEIAELMGLSEKTVQRSLAAVQERHADLRRILIWATSLTLAVFSSSI